MYFVAMLVYVIQIMKIEFVIFFSSCKLYFVIEVRQI